MYFIRAVCAADSKLYPFCISLNTAFIKSGLFAPFSSSVFLTSSKDSSLKRLARYFLNSSFFFKRRLISFLSSLLDNPLSCFIFSKTSSTLFFRFSSWRRSSICLCSSSVSMSDICFSADVLTWKKFLYLPVGSIFFSIVIRSEKCCLMSAIKHRKA